MSSNTKAYLIEAMKSLDTNNDGMVAKDELFKILKESGFSRQEAEELFKSVDMNSDGKISVQEFLAGFQ